MRIPALILAVSFLLSGCVGCAGQRGGPQSSRPGVPSVARVELPGDEDLTERLKGSVLDGGLFIAVPSERKAVADPDRVRRAALDEILWVDPDSGDSDVKVVYGDPESDGGLAGMTAVRLASWDRVWVLQVDANARWVNDPTFRKWLSGRIDRRHMVETVFEGYGEGVGGSDDPSGQRPVSAGARPRLSLHYDGEDATAGKIASRLRADLLAYQIVLAPVAGSSPGDSGVADALWLARVELDRVEFLRGVHETIPLVRVPAWLLVREELQGIEAGPAWRLDFDHARWIR
jgi:hypothetical protein